MDRGSLQYVEQKQARKMLVVQNVVHQEVGSAGHLVKDEMHLLRNVYEFLNTDKEFHNVVCTQVHME